LWQKGFEDMNTPVTFGSLVQIALMLFLADRFGTFFGFALSFLVWPFLLLALYILEAVVKVSFTALHESFTNKKWLTEEKWGLLAMAWLAAVLWATHRFSFGTQLLLATGGGFAGWFAAALISKIWLSHARVIGAFLISFGAFSSLFIFGSLDSSIKSTAAKMNAKLPHRIDGTTTLISATAEGNTLISRYDVDYSAEEVLALSLEDSMKRNFTESDCQIPLMANLLVRGAVIQHTYYANDGTEVMRIRVSNADCDAAH